MSAVSHLSLNMLDYVEFFLFVAALSLVGFLAGRGERASSADYFLAGRKLRWYVVGASYIAANISTEQFIGMVGSAYLLGVCPALYEWLNVFTFLFMIYVFVPFLLASKVVTIPEFLARRYGSAVRQTFAFVTVIANVVIFMAAVLYTGGLALHGFFGWPMPACIAVTGVFAGTWAVYGGLSSVAWTGAFTAIVKFAGASAVSVLGLLAVSGDGNIVHGFWIVIERNRALSGAWHQALEHVRTHLTAANSYNRLSVVQRADHPLTPWTGLFFLIMSVSIWYNVLNQFIIQRILGSRSIWDARMAVVFAGYVKLLLPLITVLPGLILFALHPEYLLGDWLDAQHQADQGYIVLVKELLPIGMRGLLLAVLFSAVQATITSVVNSTATILTIDIYVPSVSPSGDRSAEGDLRRMGLHLDHRARHYDRHLAQCLGRQHLSVYADTQCVLRPSLRGDLRSGSAHALRQCHRRDDRHHRWICTRCRTQALWHVPADARLVLSLRQSGGHHLDGLAGTYVSSAVVGGGSTDCLKPPPSRYGTVPCYCERDWGPSAGSTA